MNLNEHAAKIEGAALSVRSFFLLRVCYVLTVRTLDDRGRSDDYGGSGWQGLD